MQLQGVKRKIIQAISYEVTAIVLVAPIIALLFGKGLGNAATLSTILALVALFWNMAFNTLFEAWEKRQQDRTRTLKRRVIHALGFEIGFGLLIVPISAFWLDISWQAALSMNIGLMLFFMFYQFGFQWAFDKLFGVPASATAS